MSNWSCLVRILCVCVGGGGWPVVKRSTRSVGNYNGHFFTNCPNRDIAQFLLELPYGWFLCNCAFKSSVYLSESHEEEVRPIRTGRQ